MKIVVCSDNHSNFLVIKKILIDNPSADYYWHLGDSEADSLDELKPFISVKGNNDFLDLPKARVIELNNHRFLLIHGTGIITLGIEYFVDIAKNNDCDIVLYGHTHRPSDKTVDGIRLINPGSCNYNRSYANPTYAIINIDKNDNIDLKFIDC